MQLSIVVTLWCNVCGDLNKVRWRRDAIGHCYGSAMRCYDDIGEIKYSWGGGSVESASPVN